MAIGDTGQGINVGDAVLTFLGDTTQLDAAFNRVADEAAVKMGAAASSVNQVGDAVDGVTERMAVGQQGAVKLGEITTLAGEKTRASMYEARGEAGLLGEMFGIHLPRHVRSFLAELPGVGTALSAAFSATAVLFLLDALVKGSEKLSQWIANTFIFTQAMKDSDQSIKDQNKTLIALAEQIDKDSEALDKFGKTQAELKFDKISGLLAELKKNETAFAAASKAATAYATAVHESKPDEAAEQFGKLNSVLGAVAWAYVKVEEEHQKLVDYLVSSLIGGKTPAELEEEARKAGLAAQAITIETAQKIKDEKIQLRLAEREALAQSTIDQEEAAKRSIAIDETVGSAQIKRWAALAVYEASFARDSSDTILKIKQDADEKEYQLKLLSLQKQRLAEEQAVRGLQGAGDTDKANKQIAQVQSTNAKIEALTAEHFAKQKQLEEQADEALLKLRADWAVAAISLAQGLFPKLPEDTRNLLSFEQAAAKLGVTLTADVKKNVDEAKAALALLDAEFKIGKISLHDLLSAEIAVRQQQLLLNKSMGDVSGVKAMEKEIDELTKKLQKLEGETKKTQSIWDAFSADFKKRAKDDGTASQQMGQMFANTALQMQKAFESAMAAAILSEGSFAEILAKATAAILAQLSAQAAVKAIYYTAEGIAAATVGDPQASGFFAAAAEMALVSVAAGAAAYGINSAAGGGGGAGSHNSAGLSPSQTSSSGGGSNQVVSVTHLAAGGIVSSPTLFMAGDSASGGSAEEAIIPLSDPVALARIADALLSVPTLRAGTAGLSNPVAIASAANARSGGFDDASMAKLAEHIGSHLDASGGAGDTHIHHYHIKGLLDSSNLKKIIAKQNTLVQSRQVTVKASDSLRVTRRSQ